MCVSTREGIPGVRNTLDSKVGPPMVLKTTAPSPLATCHLPNVKALTPNRLPTPYTNIWIFCARPEVHDWQNEKKKGWVMGFMPTLVIIALADMALCCKAQMFCYVSAQTGRLQKHRPPIRACSLNFLRFSFSFLSLSFRSFSFLSASANISSVYQTLNNTGLLHVWRIAAADHFAWQDGHKRVYVANMYCV